MRRLTVPLAVLVGLALAGCGGGSPAPTSSGTPAPTVVTTPAETATAEPEEPAVVAGFELSGSALIAVDADGDEIATHPFSDVRGIIDALTAVLGVPSEGPAIEGCPVTIAVWPPSGSDVVVAYESGSTSTLVVTVRSGSSGIQPSEGPGFGENAAAFAGSLPAGHSTAGYAYVYDPVTTMSDGTPLGGVAFVDGAGNVESLASPSPPYGGGFC